MRRQNIYQVSQLAHLAAQTTHLTLQNVNPLSYLGFVSPRARGRLRRHGYAHQSVSVVVIGSAPAVLESVCVPPGAVLVASSSW